MTNIYTILIVEDERPLLEAIKLKLEASGLEAVTARTVDQALGYLTELPKIDAIWLDHYLLGKESGLDLVSKIKSDSSNWKHIPVFVVSNTASNTASNDKVLAYMQLGVNKYYIKSNFRLDQIIAEIKNELQYGTKN